MSVVTGLDAQTEHADFAGLTIEWDDRVLRPRPWTAEQGRWAAELAATAPEGPILELCSGAGHIGILAARDAGRPLVQVDRNPVAVAYARRNAEAAGVDAEVRCGPLASALAEGEVFGIVIADPPWLRSKDVVLFPEDPHSAVDGGADGCELIRACIDVGLGHLAAGGHLLVQIGDEAQLTQVKEHVARHWPDHAVVAVRDCRPGGMIVDIGDSKDKDSDEGGQVSEVSGLDDAGGTITPGDSVAGHPTDQGEDSVDEGATGPDARTGNQDTDKEPR
ncbi:methyltransferase [Nocardioides sp. SYSU DS0651]|uniref:methyltransferase n=1 Tax=Nocardioides sp. SYSU DS0651 TaxID=3415955 RepID=UPI003F4C1E78